MQEKYPDDITLVTRCRNGESKYQYLLFDKYYHEMLALCTRYTKNEDDAKDVLQNGFIKVFTHLDTLKDVSVLPYWIKQIMVRSSLDFYKKKHKEFTVTYSIDEDVRVDTTLEENISVTEMMYLIQELPYQHQMAFNLFVLEGYSHKEIAEMLSTTEGNSKWLVFEARKKIKAAIEVYYGTKITQHLYEKAV